MAALLTVWMGLACLAFAGVMVIWRSTFNDFTLWLLLWLACPGTMCIAGLVLWAYRKRGIDEPGLRAQRIQCWVAIVLATVAAAVVYLLVVRAQRVPAGLPQ